MPKPTPVPAADLAPEPAPEQPRLLGRTVAIYESGQKDPAHTGHVIVAYENDLVDVAVDRPGMDLVLYGVHPRAGQGTSGYEVLA